MEGSSIIEVQEEHPVNLRDILIKCSRYWHWFVIGVVIVMLGAYLYIRYTTPVYEANAELLIKDKTSGSAAGDLQNDILGQLNLLSGNSNVQNEMAILQSRTIIDRAARDLNLRTAYFIEGRVKSKELYTKTPVLITPIFLKDSTQTQHLAVRINSDLTYTLSDDKSQMNVSGGATATLSSGIYLVRNNPIKTPDSAYNQIQVIVSPISEIINRLQRNLSLSQTDKTSSVIKLTIRTTVPEKGEDFLNSLIREYSLAGLADKNQTAANTINFVDSRLDSIAGGLSSVESKLEHFLSANSIANLDEQSKLFIDQAGQLDQQIVQQNMQTGVLKQIQQYVSQPSMAHNLVPSTLGIEDPTLLSLVQGYNTLQLQRTQQIAAGASASNPMIDVIDQQLNKLRNDIKENTSNLLQGAKRVSAQLKKQNQDFESKIQNVPRVQRDYITIKRQQDIKQTLYIYLLQKREEAAITEAASVYNNRVIDSAKTGINPISPKKKLIYLAAFLLGLAIPGGLIYLKELLSRRIASIHDVEMRTDVPVYGEIGHSKEEGPIVVVSGSRGAVPEQFRNLRTNLSFVLGGGVHKVILITSSMGGEGKSFVSLNLAMTYALMGKRTVLLGMDLRKPKIGNYLAMEHKQGISNYLSGQLTLEELPVKLKFGEQNLYFINSGPVPPNPAELLLQPRIEELMDYLKVNFDYIIFDTPPVGLVTDAQILGKYADVSLYIVRHQYTMKDQIKLLDSYFKGKRLPKLGIVLNDIKAGDSYKYGYGGYGYGNEYYLQKGALDGSANKINEQLNGAGNGKAGNR